jgi:hypothetical protein
MNLQKERVLYLSERSADNIIGFHIVDRLKEEDIKRYRSILEGTIAQFGDVRLLISLDRPGGSDPEDIWEDLKLSTRYKKGIECVALVGDQAVKGWAQGLFDWVETPEVHYFSHREYDEAWKWLKQD